LKIIFKPYFAQFDIELLGVKSMVKTGSRGEINKSS